MVDTLRARFTSASAKMPRRALQIVFVLLTAAVLAVLGLRSRSHLAELRQFSHPGPGWLVLAVLAQVASLAAYALVVRELLGLGKVTARLLTLMRTTVGGIAMTASLPGGKAASAVYWYRQLKQQGADGGLTGLAMVGSMLAGVLSLAGLVVAGVAAAGGEGPLAAARIPILAGAIALLTLQLLFRRRVARTLVSLVRRLAPGLPDDFSAGRRSVLAIATLAFANWLLDCVCLYAALAAVHASVPLHGIVLTYALAQLTTILPLLPGGGGTVEVTLTLGFAAFGHTSGSVIAGVLLFRLISCWGLVPVGWLAVALEGRRIPLGGFGRPAVVAVA